MRAICVSNLFCSNSLHLSLRFASLGLFFTTIFSCHLIPRPWDSNPCQQSCTRLGPLKDGLPTELQRRCLENFKLDVAAKLCVVTIVLKRLSQGTLTFILKGKIYIRLTSSPYWFGLVCYKSERNDECTDVADS